MNFSRSLLNEINFLRRPKARGYTATDLGVNKYMINLIVCVIQGKNSLGSLR